MADKQILLQPGDMGVVKTSSWIAGTINAAQKFMSKDGHAIYNHAFLIVSGDGTTLESLAKIKHYHISEYTGRRIMIVRHKDMTGERFQAGYKAVKKYDGKLYPFWRLPLQFSHLAKYIHWTYPVCSELVGEFLNHAGLFSSTGWGWTPDNLADLWAESKHYDIIHIGRWGE